jgi:hypothetical protein
MTVTNNCLIGTHYVETALSLLGPANFGSSEPQGCLDHIALVLNHIAIFVLKLFNLICGDHQWYDNDIARHMIEQYSANPQPNTPLDQQVRQLFNALLLRANGTVSYADGLNADFLQLREPHVELPLMGNRGTIDDQPLDEQTSPLLTIIPPEILFSEILPRCDGDSLMSLQLTCSRLHASIKGEPKPYKDLLINLALKKALAIANRQDDRKKIQVLCEFAKIQTSYNQELAKTLLQKALEITNNLPDTLITATGFAVITKPEALSKIASVQACIAPEVAMTTASMIEKSRWLNEALQSISLQQAATNMEAAIQTASRIVSEDNYCLQMLFKKEALTNPEQALIHTLHWISNPLKQSLVLQKIAEILTPTNPSRAIEIANMTHSSVKQSTLSQIAIAQASNPEETLRIVNQLDGQEIKDKTLCAVAIKQASLISFEQALETVHLIQDSLWRVEALCEIADQLVETNRSRMEELCLEALNIARYLTDSKRDYALYRVVKSQISVNLFHAQETKNLISNGSALHAPALFAIIKAQALTVVEDALETVRHIHERSNKEFALNIIAQIQGLTNFNQALDRISLIEEESQRRDFISDIAKAHALKNVEEALLCAGRIENNVLKINTLCNILKANALARPDKSNDFLHQGLSHAARIADEPSQIDALIQVTQTLMLPAS